MEGVPCEREGGKLRLGHLRSGLVVVPIVLALIRKPDLVVVALMSSMMVR